MSFVYYRMNESNDRTCPLKEARSLRVNPAGSPVGTPPGAK